MYTAKNSGTGSSVRGCIYIFIVMWIRWCRTTKGCNLYKKKPIYQIPGDRKKILNSDETGG